jgi:predicted DNA-binding protein (MmcQ/YjbR family)
MTIEDLQKICKQHKGVTQDIKWEHHLCFNIGGKMFLMLSPDEVPINATFKVSDEEFTELSEQSGFRPAPYLARHKWVGLDDINRLSKKKWEYFIEQAYRLVFEKLPKKEQMKILTKK